MSVKRLLQIRIPFRALLGIGLTAALLGCQKPDEVRVYETPKEQHFQLKPRPIATGPKFTTPDGWQAIKVEDGGMRKAAYTVAKEDQKAEVTVIDLPPVAADRLSNINRWRGQIQLDPITAAELDALIKPIEADGMSGDYVEMAMPEGSSPRKMILGALVDGTDRVWFFKLRGDHALAEQERERFKEFVRSAKIKSVEGAP